MADDQAAVLFDGAASVGPTDSTSAPSSDPSTSTSLVASPAAPGALHPENDASKAEGPGRGGSGRKRVFTFQKRWLHTLPIMERALPASIVSGTPMKPRISDAAALSSSPTGEDGKALVVCMLCEDPASKRDAPKIWSRVNCRRGRIENHLWSKHPEFMMLLKQKQETEGDLAVQIFLQSMRDGRCNVRSEIGAGLYAHLHSGSSSAGSTGGAGAKRALEQQQSGVHEPVDPDAAQKRAKVDMPKDTAAGSGTMFTTGMAAFNTSGTAPRTPGTREGDGDSACAAAYEVGQALPAYSEAPALTALSSWSISLLNKVVVMTGGDNEVMMNAAAQLWSLGASVLITFSDRSMLDVFMSTSLARCPETHEHLGIPRGVMLPLLCEFTAHKQLDDWSRSIAARFPRVHCLINYVHVADDRVERSSGASEGETPAIYSSNAPGRKDTLGSTMDRLRAISSVVTTHCVPSAAAPGADSGCTVINVTSQVAASIQAVRAWAKSAAHDALPKLVHANFIEIPGIRLGASVAADAAKSASHPERPQHAAATTALLHTVALLCSPAGRSISGSVLRIESEAARGAGAVSDGDAAASEGGSSVTATSVSGADGAAGEGGVHIV